MKKRLDVLVCEQNRSCLKAGHRPLLCAGRCLWRAEGNQKRFHVPLGRGGGNPGSQSEICEPGVLKLASLQTFSVTERKVCGYRLFHGGFTDCMLQNGAEKVYAVDVGKGQLHYKLRKRAGCCDGEDEYPLCDTEDLRKDAVCRH